MADERNNGGSAFPVPGDVYISGGDEDPQFQSGMSLRDWFAGQALMGMNASPALLECVTSAEAGAGTHLERLARSAYQTADAMLRARDA